MKIYDRMKQNRFTLYFKIWIIHIIIYYMAFGFILEMLELWYREWPLNWEFAGKILTSPLVGGVFGFYDGFPMYFMLSIFIFLILITFPQINTLYSYSISVILSYIVVKYFIYLNRSYPFNILLRSNQKETALEISLLYAIIPALFVSSICIFFLLKKHFTDQRN